MKFSKAITFITFSAYTDFNTVEKHFNSQHEKFQSAYPYWSIHATHRKLRASFWYYTAFMHYAALCLLAVILVMGIDHSFLHNPLSLLIALVVILCLFIPIAAFIYMPSFYSSYLPLLESCIERYSGKQLEGIQKCKQQQYSVMALMLIQYAFNRIAGVETEPFSDTYSCLMMKQYGVSQKMVDTCQRIIVLNRWEQSKERKRTEIIEAFEEATGYFNTLQIPAAAEALQALKVRLLQRAKTPLAVC